LAALCHALATRHGVLDGRTVDLAAARALAAEQARRRAGRTARTSFLVDGLLRQVDVTIRAGAAALDGAGGGTYEQTLRATFEELEELHVMWHNLELYELADVTALTRNALGVLTGRRMSAVTHGADVADYLVGISGTDARPMHRVQAELLVGAARVAHSTYKAAVPLVEAASVAITAGLGNRLAFELCSVVAEHTSASREERHDVLLGYLLDPAHDHPGLFDAPDADVDKLGIRYFNCITDGTSAEGRRLRALLREALEERQRSLDPWLADLVTQQLQMRDIQYDGPPADAGALAAVLSEWEARVWNGAPPGMEPAGGSPPAMYLSTCRRRHHYVLQYLWDTVEQPGSAVAEHAARLLAECDDEQPGHAPVTLASLVTARLDLMPESDPETLARALRIQRDGIESVAAQLAPASARSIYERLARFDAEHAAEHTAQAQFWRAEEERMHEERLVHHVARGRYFDVFWHHFTRVPELPCDLEREHVAAPAAATGDGDRSTVPAALVFGADGLPTAVSGAFLRAGHRLFHGTASANGGQEERDAIDRAAQDEIGNLYWLLMERTSVSNELREIFRRQRRRFDVA
jgi:hypothetical protein